MVKFIKTVLMKDRQFPKKKQTMITRWARTHAKSCKLETTFAFFIRLSSNLAGW